MTRSTIRPMPSPRGTNYEQLFVMSWAASRLSSADMEELQVLLQKLMHQTTDFEAAEDDESGVSAPLSQFRRLHQGWPPGLVQDNSGLPKDLASPP